MPHALLVDDDRDSLDALEILVEERGFTVAKAGSLNGARQRAGEQPPDLILTDLFLPDGLGLDLAETAREHGSEMVLMTGHASLDTAVEALRQGISDYLTKPLDLPRLEALLGTVARTRQLKEEISSLRGELRQMGRFGALIGRSQAMQEVYDLIARAAPTDTPVLIIGESGTGKALLARTVHQLSERRRGPLATLDCSAVAPSLIESELFGHERGGGGGPGRSHPGAFERAAGGTLVLNAVDHMPLELQARLLHALEEGTFQRLGGTKPVPIDARLLVTSDRHLQEEVTEGRVREDLLYHLAVFPVELPPLAERGEDVPLLAASFCEELNREAGTSKLFTVEAIRCLREYDWPGNVQELRNVVERAFILADEDIGVSCLPPTVQGAERDELPAASELPVGMPLAQVERLVILATLEAMDGEKKATAQMLGISLKTLYNKLAAYRREGYLDDGGKGGKKKAEKPAS